MQKAILLARTKRRYERAVAIVRGARHLHYRLSRALLDRERQNHRFSLRSPSLGYGIRNREPGALLAEASGTARSWRTSKLLIERSAKGRTPRS
jgi:hypothetical protein